MTVFPYSTGFPHFWGCLGFFFQRGKGTFITVWVFHLFVLVVLIPAVVSVNLRKKTFWGKKYFCGGEKEIFRGFTYTFWGFIDKGEHQKSLLEIFAISFHTVATHLFTLKPEVIHTTSGYDLLRSQKLSRIRATQALAERSPRKTSGSREWDGGGVFPSDSEWSQSAARGSLYRQHWAKRFCVIKPRSLQKQEI